MGRLLGGNQQEGNSGGNGGANPQQQQGGQNSQQQQKKMTGMQRLGKGLASIPSHSPTMPSMGPTAMPPQLDGTQGIAPITTPPMDPYAGMPAPQAPQQPMQPMQAQPGIVPQSRF